MSHAPGTSLRKETIVREKSFAVCSDDEKASVSILSLSNRRMESNAVSSQNQYPEKRTRSGVEMAESARNYLPAAGKDLFLPFYDPLVKLLGGDKARRALLDQAALRPGQRVLDVGCGTGTLAILVKRLHPDVEVVGVDPDPKALVRAKRKAAREGVAIKF